MLIEFRVKNFKSIKDEQSLSFVASNRYDSNELNHNVIETDLTFGNLVKSNFIYGANASGKSNLIEAITVMREIVLGSLKLNPGQQLPVTPFKLDNSSRHDNSLFEVSLLIDNTIYQYGFEVNRNGFEEEWLFYTPLGRSRRAFERTGAEIKAGVDLKLSKNITEGIAKNVSFLAWGAKWEDNILKKVFDWFADSLKSVRIGREHYLSARTAKMIYNGSFSEEIKKLVKAADLGITDVNVMKDEVVKLSMDIPGNPPEEISEIVREIIEAEAYKTEFIHSGNVSNNLKLREESTGTISFFGFCGPLVEAVHNGHFVLIDEIEASIHPALVEHLVRYFHNNSRNAQLLATTHNTNLLRNDAGALRRDQVCFVEKDANGASEIYPLSQFHTRKGNSIEERYLAGKFGAVPNITDDLMK